MTSIYWQSFEDLVNGLDQIWYETQSGQSRSRELRAVHELGRCHLALAPAMCFFAGRMVETAVSGRWAAFQKHSGNLSTDSWVNLDEQINHLQQLGRLDDLLAACIHTVRKLANNARHRAAFPTLADATFCLALLKVALPWMGDENRAEVQRVCDAHAVTELDHEVKWLLNASTLASPSLDFPGLLQAAPNLLRPFGKMESTYPTDVTNWVTQQCINAKRLDLAGELIAPFLQNGDANAPQVRADRDGHRRVSHINRLIALRLSRMGNASSAINLLTGLGKQAGYLDGDGSPVPLRSDNSHAYAEALGILAGAHKTLWSEQPEPARLTIAAAHYQHALRAEPWNTYLAINAAACSAWAGDLTTARSICSVLMRLLEPSPTGREKGGVENLWNMLTHAEALLISGLHAAAIDRYRSVGRLFNQTHAGDIQRALFQVRIHKAHRVLDESTFASIAQALDSVG